MSNRRSHPRLDLATPLAGSMHLARDVRVLEAAGRELIVAASSPGVVGETVLLDVIAPSQPVTLRLRVTSSRPVMVDGILRHEIRLEREGADLRAGDESNDRASA